MIQLTHSVRAYDCYTTNTQGDNIDGAMRFPCILRRVEFFQLCTISLFRRPSPTCPADRTPLLGKVSKSVKLHKLNK